MEIDLQYFIQQIKKRENLRFDSHVADYMGVDPKNLAMNKMRKVIPIKYMQWYCDKYNVEKTEFEGHLKGSGVIDNESEENVDYTIIAQQETIKLQKEKIAELERKLARCDVHNEEIDLLLEWMLTNAYQEKAKKMMKH